MDSRARGASGLVALALVLGACTIDDADAARLTDLALAFEAPPGWSEAKSADGPVDDFPLLQDGDNLFCFGNDICVAAVRRWLLAEDAAVDLDAIGAAVDATTGWQLAYQPDCTLEGDEARDRALPGMRACRWEAAADDDVVLVTLDRFGPDTPWQLKLSARLDDHVENHDDSPVLAARRRTVGAALVEVASRFTAPDDWLLLHDVVEAEPRDCLAVRCLTARRTWIDAAIDADSMRRLLEDAGYRLVTNPESCAPDAEDTVGASQPPEGCSATATSGGAHVVLRARPQGDAYRVHLEVTRDPAPPTP